MLKIRGLEAPDGRPLYAYRFARADYDRVADILRRWGASAAYDRTGAALIVSHVAEWFRRERDGGHWDWIRPLRSIGIRYGPQDSIQYADIENLVQMGLQVWRRPQPVGGERLLAIVRESGFPVAAVRADTKISSWLKNAVLGAERGFRVSDAVGAETWRVSDRLAQALYEPAVELCDAIVHLRSSIPVEARRDDPVGFLDRHRPNWRNDLPFDVECEDIRSMIEQIVRLREGGAAALDLERRLVLTGDGKWASRASLGLSGSIDLRRLPESIATAVRSGGRLRLFPRPPFADDLVAIAAIETYQEEGNVVHEVRPFVATYDTELSLQSEARLLVQAGHSTVGEFVPSGGQALTDPVIAMKIEKVDESETPIALKVLGSSSAQTSQTALALAVRAASFASMSFTQGYRDLGTCEESGWRVVSFSGSATIDLDGVRWRWKTSAERDVEARLILIGDLVRNARESIFLGVPRCWIEKDGHVVTPKRNTLHWRPRGRGKWRPIEDGPWGEVDLAIIEGDEVRYSTSAAIVPPEFDVSFDRVRRTLRVAGLTNATMAASGARNLTVSLQGNVATIDLGPPSGTPTIVLRPRWQSELTVTLADPSYELRLIDETDHLVTGRPVFAVDGLRGYRVLATREVSLCMELRANDAPRLAITRPVSGDVPLSAVADTIRQLLGRSESLDASVVLSAIGANERIAEVKWYAEDVDPFDVPKQNAFAALAATHGLDLRALSLPNPMEGTASVDAPASQHAMQAELGRTLPGGPWLLFGRRRRGPTIRPRILPALRPDNDPSALRNAITIDDAARRTAELARLYAEPSAVPESDIKILIDLFTAVRGEDLPLSCIDALKALDQAPEMAVFLLASCETLNQRAALLGLQRDLPFLWCSVTIKAWLAGFEARSSKLLELLASLGVDPAVAGRSMLAALDEIVVLRPELAGHAKAVYLLLVAGRQHGAFAQSNDGSFIHSLREPDPPGEIRKLISRHEDGDHPPQNLVSSATLAAHKVLWLPYDPSFAEVIAAPFAVADHAVGRRALDRSELLRCRDASLYDPEYFETTVPAWIGESLRNLTRTEAGRS